MTDLIAFFLIMFGVPAGLIFCTIVARDMDKRGLDGRIYGLITLVFLPLGLGVWFYKRSTTPVVEEPRPGR